MWPLLSQLGGCNGIQLFVHRFPLAVAGQSDGHTMVEVVTTPGFYCNSGRVSEVERNERQSD